VNGMNRVGEIVAPAAFGTPRALFKEQVAAAPTALPSYWLLLGFLVLLYANTPFLVPAAEVLRPAKVAIATALLAFTFEMIDRAHARPEPRNAGVSLRGERGD